jgi:hypothetical protein
MLSHSLKAGLKIGEITAAGIMKRVRLSPEQLASLGQGQGKRIAAWKVWAAVLVFLGLLVVVSILAAKLG